MEIQPGEGVWREGVLGLASQGEAVDAAVTTVSRDITRGCWRGVRRETQNYMHPERTREKKVKVIFILCTITRQKTHFI